MNDYSHWQYHGYDIIRTGDIYNTCGQDFDCFGSALAFIDAKCLELTKGKSYYMVPSVYTFYGIGLYACVKENPQAHWCKYGELYHVLKNPNDHEYFFMLPCNQSGAFGYEMDTFNKYFRCVQLYLS